MKPIRARALLLATLAAFAVAVASAPAAGDSRSLSLKGQVPGDGESVVKVDTVRQGGATTVVKRFRFKKILAECDGYEDLQRITLQLTGRIPVGENRLYGRSYGDGSTGVVKVSGRVSRTGNRTVGLVRSKAVTVLGIGTCKVVPTTFRATN